jgi:trehalose 6-phosphate phosphatase
MQFGSWCRDTRAVSGQAETGERGGGTLLESLRADPARTAILTDVDGTLAPIVERPDQAAVPERARELLDELGRRYRLVGCISGRQALEARRLVGVEGLAYAGNHGFELLLPGDEEPRLDPALAGRERDAAEFLAGLDSTELEGSGLRREDKGPIQALHWRGAGDERAAEARAREIAAEAGRAKLEPRWGRKVLELRPVGGGGKDSAVGALLAEDGVVAAAYAGDDRTDLDAFRRLRELREAGELETVVCVGVTSAEAPPELAEEADLCVDGPDGWLSALQTLAE